MSRGVVVRIVKGKSRDKALLKTNGSHWPDHRRSKWPKIGGSSCLETKGLHRPEQTMYHWPLFNLFKSYCNVNGGPVNN